MLLRDVPPEAEVALAQQLAPHVDELWIVEDLEWAGGVAQLAAILQATDKVTLGHGIAPAPFRNPAALAMEWATLARMFPGRIHGGIGHGVQTWMEQLGEKVASPLGLLEETIVATKQILAGQSVTTDGRYVQVRDVALKYPPAEVPLVSAGVVGPKSLELAGRVADGTIISEGFSPPQIADARARIDTGREAAGRTDPHRITVFVGFYCGDLSKLGPPPPDAPQGWDVVGPDVDSVLPDLQAMVDAGADAMVLVPFGADAPQQLELAATEIWPRLTPAE